MTPTLVAQTLDFSRSDLYSDFDDFDEFDEFDELDEFEDQLVAH